MTSLTPQQRREMFALEFRRILGSFVPSCAGSRYSGQQIARAKGLARKRMMEL